MKLHPDGINMSKLTTKDLRAVSLFHRIIKNYIKLKRLTPKPKDMKIDRAENFYELQRAMGETEDITGNDNPDYTLPFYQSIFRLLESYAQEQEREAFNRGYAAGMFFDVNNPNDNEQRNRAFDRWKKNQA